MVSRYPSGEPSPKWFLLEATQNLWKRKRVGMGEIGVIISIRHDIPMYPSPAPPEPDGIIRLSPLFL